MHPVLRMAGPYPRDLASVFEMLPGAGGRMLLESAGGPEDLCQRSILTARPFALLVGRRQRYVLQTSRGRFLLVGSPFEVLQRVLVEVGASLPRGPLGLAEPLELPEGFAGGAIGYLSYDLGRQVERLPVQARDDLGLPELWVALYDSAIVVDHRRREAVVVGRILPDRRHQVASHARFLLDVLERAQTGEEKAEDPWGYPEVGVVTSVFTRRAFEEAVGRALRYIRNGDIFQVNLSQRFCAPWPGTPWCLYRRLRKVNPAPFAAFLDCGRFAVASASPERFLRVDPATRRVETRPIKGTRPRGGDPEEDTRYAKSLWESRKDLAELVMIVDLERNDLGRVCEYGSVRVPVLRRLEAYPTVWHTVAVIEGRLRERTGPARLLQATFPGGSITGAPKVRAMEIIEELEPVRRGVYTGSIGWIGWDGALDLNIAIRTITLVDGRAFFHAGGGIVADSDPAAEYEETLAKAAGLCRALRRGVGDDAVVRVAE